MKIKQTMRFLKSASAATALVLATSVNAAQISSASTTINWNDIQVYSNNQLLLNSEYTLRFPSFGGGLAYSNARTYPFPSGSMPYSSAPQFNQSVAEGNVGTASSTTTGMSATALAQNGLAGALSFSEYGSQPLTLTFNTAGTYQVIIPYQLSINVTGLAEIGERVSTNSSIDFRSFNGGMINQKLFYEAADGLSYLTTDQCVGNQYGCPITTPVNSNTFNGSFSALVSGSSVALNLGANALATSYIPSIVSAPVPIPATAWLLGSGLLGLIGVARRKAA